MKTKKNNSKSKNYSKEYKILKFQGITLISLIITIVVILILSGISIYISLGNNGIFNKAKEAGELTSKKEATDIINLKITTAQMNKYADKQEMPTLKELSLILKDDEEIQYVTQTSKIANVEYDVPSENPTSIYTKLNKYPYEFEINSSLQLASINGIKLANGYNNEEYDNYREKVAQTLTKNGVDTGKEDPIETVVNNIDNIAKENFLAGVNSKFVKIAENVSSRFVQKIDVKSVPNYEKYSEEDFIIVNKSMKYSGGTDGEDILYMTRSYNKENGILQLGKQKTYVAKGAQWTFWNLYDVYVFTK